MAHRKPLGTLTSWMAFDWHGEHPLVGDYLVSDAGTWYRVAGVEEKTNGRKVGLMLERVARPPALDDCDTHAPTRWVIEGTIERRVFEFQWWPRDRRAA